MPNMGDVASEEIFHEIIAIQGEQITWTQTKQGGCN